MSYRTPAPPTSSASHDRQQHRHHQRPASGSLNRSQDAATANDNANRPPSGSYRRGGDRDHSVIQRLASANTRKRLLLPETDPSALLLHISETRHFQLLAPSWISRHYPIREEPIAPSPVVVDREKGWDKCTVVQHRVASELPAVYPDVDATGKPRQVGALASSASPTRGGSPSFWASSSSSSRPGTAQQQQQRTSAAGGGTSSNRGGARPGTATSSYASSSNQHHRSSKPYRPQSHSSQYYSPGGGIQRGGGGAAGSSNSNKKSSSAAEPSSPSAAQAAAKARVASATGHRSKKSIMQSLTSVAIKHPALIVDKCLHEAPRVSNTVPRSLGGVSTDSRRNSPNRGTGAAAAAAAAAGKNSSSGGSSHAGGGAGGPSSGSGRPGSMSSRDLQPSTPRAKVKNVFVPPVELPPSPMMAAASEKRKDHRTSRYVKLSFAMCCDGFGCPLQLLSPGAALLGIHPEARPRSARCSSALSATRSRLAAVDNALVAWFVLVPVPMRGDEGEGAFMIQLAQPFEQCVDGRVQPPLFLTVVETGGGGDKKKKKKKKKKKDTQEDKNSPTRRTEFSEEDDDDKTEEDEEEDPQRDPDLERPSRPTSANPVRRSATSSPNNIKKASVAPRTTTTTTTTTGKYSSSDSSDDNSDAAHNNNSNKDKYDDSDFSKSSGSRSSSLASTPSSHHRRGAQEDDEDVASSTLRPSSAAGSQSKKQRRVHHQDDFEEEPSDNRTTSAAARPSSSPASTRRPGTAGSQKSQQQASSNNSNPFEAVKTMGVFLMPRIDAPAEYYAQQQQKQQQKNKGQQQQDAAGDNKSKTTTTKKKKQKKVKDPRLRQRWLLNPVSGVLPTAPGHAVSAAVLDVPLTMLFNSQRYRITPVNNSRLSLFVEPTSGRLTVVNCGDATTSLSSAASFLFARNSACVANQHEVERHSISQTPHQRFGTASSTATAPGGCRGHPHQQHHAAPGRHPHDQDGYENIIKGDHDGSGHDHHHHDHDRGFFTDEFDPKHHQKHDSSSDDDDSRAHHHDDEDIAEDEDDDDADDENERLLDVNEGAAGGGGGAGAAAEDKDGESKPVVDSLANSPVNSARRPQSASGTRPTHIAGIEIPALAPSPTAVGDESEEESSSHHPRRATDDHDGTSNHDDTDDRGAQPPGASTQPESASAAAAEATVTTDQPAQASSDAPTAALDVSDSESEL